MGQLCSDASLNHAYCTNNNMAALAPQLRARAAALALLGIATGAFQWQCHAALQAGTPNEFISANLTLTAGGPNCDPSAKPPKLCPGSKPCPPCGQPACPCSGKPSPAPPAPTPSPPSPPPPAVAHAAGGSSALDDLTGSTLRTQNFYHVPGPNPILVSSGRWHPRNGTVSITQCACLRMAWLWHEPPAPPHLFSNSPGTHQVINHCTSPRYARQTTGGDGSWDGLELECAGGV